MSWKGLISRISDECLMKQEFGFPFCIVYQAVMRKFTLAGKSWVLFLEFHVLSMASIYYCDGVAIYRVGEIPPVGISHVVACPLGDCWLATEESILNAKD